MNNSSDSENNYDNKNKIDSQKKRGRPRKNLYLDKTVTKSSERKEITNEEKDIILHLPVFLPKGSVNSNNTKKVEKKTSDVSNISNISDVSDVSDSEESDSNSDKSSESEDKNETVLSVSENNSSDESSDSSDSEESIDYKKLYKKEVEENKKKDMIIKSLKEEKSKNSSNIFDSEIQKDLKVRPINLHLVDNSTNKLVETKKTDLCCWWCTYQFENDPCFIPEKYYNDKYYVFGCFCSFNCAASYNLNINDYKVMERYALLKKIYNINLDKKSKLAPPKEVLTKYGGIVSIENYRKNFVTCDKEYRINLPPLVAIHHIIEEVTIEKNDTKESNISNIKKKLPMVKNNLFNTMGIKNK